MVPTVDDEAVDSVEKDKPTGRWPWVWAVWAFLAVGTFFAIEIPALMNNTGGDTLTEQVQFLGGKAPIVFLIVLLGFVVWLVDHFAGKVSRVWKWSRLRKNKGE